MKRKNKLSNKKRTLKKELQYYESFAKFGLVVLRGLVIEVMRERKELHKIKNK